MGITLAAHRSDTNQTREQSRSCTHVRNVYRAYLNNKESNACETREGAVANRSATKVRRLGTRQQAGTTTCLGYCRSKLLLAYTTTVVVLGKGVREDMVDSRKLLPQSAEN